MNEVLVLNISGLVVLLTALVLHIVCLSTPHYLKSRYVSEDPDEPENGNLNTGLWKLCMNDHMTPESCIDWGQKMPGVHWKAADWMVAVQAMAILGMIFQVVAGLGAAVSLMVKSQGERLRLLPLALAAICGAAALFILIGDIIIAACRHTTLHAVVINDDNGDEDGADDVGAGEENPVFKQLEDNMKLDWGCGLDIATVVLTLAAGGALFLSGRIANRNNGAN